MPRDPSDDPTLARISSLETSVNTLTGDIRSIAESVDKLRGMISDNQKPQWGNWIAAMGVGLIVLSAIGASFIAPLSIQLNHHDNTISETGRDLRDIQNRVQDVEVKSSANRESIDREISAVKDTLYDVRVYGSAITRERLAILEHVAGIGPRIPKAVGK